MSGPKATVIGKVAIKVVPNTDDFRRDAQRALDRIEKQLDPIKIELELSVSSKKKIQGELDLLSRRREVTFTPKVNKAAAAKVASTLGALSGGRSIRDLGTDIADWAGQLDKQVPRIAGVALAVANLSSAALTGSANLFSLGSSLASTVGAGLALPGIFGGLAIGLGASIAVLKDFNKRLPEVKGKLSDLQNQMSDRFWNRAEEPIRNLVNSLLPEISKGLDGTSTSLGTFFAKLANSANGQFGGELQGMFNDLNKSVRIAAGDTDVFIGIIQKLGSVGAGNLPRLARWFGDISEKFDGFLAHKGKSGLQDIVDQGINALSDLGGVISGTGSLLAGLSRAAEASGASTLATLDRTVNAAAKKVNGAKFQNALQDAFAGARTGLDELTDRSGKQFESLMLRISDLLSNALPKAGKTAGTALGAIFDGLDQPQVEASLLGFLDNIDTSVNNLAPTLPGVARGLAAVVDVVGQITTNVSRGLAPILTALGNSLPRLSRDFAPLITELGDLTEHASELGASVLPDLALSLGGTAQALATALRPVNALLDLLEQLPQPIKDVSSGLVTMGLIATAATWLGGSVRAKVIGFSESLLVTASNAKVAQGALLKTAGTAEAAGAAMTRGRLALAGAGLALGTLSSQAVGTDSKLNILASTASGALIGSAFGPGWGTAIGAAGGALFGLYQYTHQANGELDKGKAAATDYASSLDQITGAATGATRALVLQDLQTKGLLDAGAALGLTSRDLVNSVLGQANAYDKVRAAVEGAVRSSNQVMGANGQVTRTNQKAYDAAVALTGGVDGLSDSIDKSRKKVVAQSVAVADLSAVYKVFPKIVATKIDATGIEPTKKGIAELAIQYNAMDKRHVQALISASGTQFTVQQIQNVIDRLAAIHDKTVVITTVNKRGGVTSSAGGHSDDEGAGKRAADGYNAGFAKELTKFLSKIQDSYQKAIEKAGKHAQALKDRFAESIKGFRALANEHAKLEKQLDSAQATLQSYQDQQAAYAETVRSTIVASADVTTLGAHTYDGLIRALGKARDKAIQFKDTILALTSSGLNATTLKQILAAGPEAGLAIAKAILAGGVQQVNDIQAQIDAAAQIVGDASGQHFFGDLVASAQSDVDKLLDQLGPLQARLQKFAHDLIKSLSEALKKEWKGQMGDGGAFTAEAVDSTPGTKGSSVPKPPSGHRSASPSIGKQVNLTYIAAPGKSISSEEELWEALDRAG